MRSGTGLNGAAERCISSLFGDRLWIRGAEIRIRAQIENDVTDRKGALLD